MKIAGITLLVMMMLGRCSPEKVSSEERLSDALTIRTGSSFGMCTGYCLKDYEINGTRVTLTTTSRSQTQYPTKTCQTTLSQEGWNALKAVANPDAFSKLPERIGCPDCADGGAEYIELEIGDQKHRVTFEYGQTIPGFESLVTTLRAQREAFSECK